MKFFFREINKPTIKEVPKTRRELILEDLEKTKPNVAKEFKKIVKIADKDSSAMARQNIGAYHKFLKCIRPNKQFVGIGAAVGMLGGILYNALNHRDRA